MTEWINRSDALDIVHNAYDGWFSDESISYIHGARAAKDDIYRKISEIPAMPEMQPIENERHGHWNYVEKGALHNWFECSCCGKRNSYMPKFCPNCGAKMDGEEDE